MDDTQISEIIHQLKNIAGNLEIISQGRDHVIVLVITSISAAAAALAAFFSWKTVREMETNRLDEFRPILKWGGNQSDPDDPENLVFNFENEGKGPAYDITFYYPDKNKLEISSDSKILKQKKEAWATIDNSFFEKLETFKKIIIEYEDIYQRKFETHVTLNVKKIKGDNWIKSINGDFKQILKSK